MIGMVSTGYIYEVGLKTNTLALWSGSRVVTFVSLAVDLRPQQGGNKQHNIKSGCKTDNAQQNHNNDGRGNTNEERNIRSRIHKATQIVKQSDKRQISLRTATNKTPSKKLCFK